MKYARLSHDDHTSWIRIEGNHAVEISDAPWTTGVSDLKRFPFDSCAKLLPPCQPTKIICVGKNYREHVKELHPGEEAPSEPLLFLKPTSALLEPEGVIIMPPESQRVDYEGELAVVIGKRLSRPTLKEARAGIFGYTTANDVTARDLQKKDGQWTRGKGFDTFCPVGPFLSTDDPGSASIATRVNGQIRQQSSLSLMVHSPAEVVRYAAGIMTLFPGDLILTGTPEGVGPLASGDIVEVEIEGIGVLRNHVKTL
jgi:2-keto-4-pentenoate hydratase/2-oxohepta-3-ene-1,7-dioic acid hydratase in catechol pathway